MLNCFRSAYPSKLDFLLHLIAISHFWACKVTTFFWNHNDLQHFFSKKITLPLFYWHFKNMLYNIFSSKPPISPPKTPSKPYLFSPLSASFVAKKSKIHAFFADTGKFLPKNLYAIFISQYSTHYIKPFLSLSTDTSDVDDEA